MARKDFPVIQRGLALVLCADQAALEESLTHLDIDVIPHQRLGNRALLVPTKFIAEIRATLHEQGVFPRVIGELEPPTPQTTSEEEAG